MKPGPSGALPPHKGQKVSASSPSHPVAGSRLVSLQQAAAILNVSIASTRRLVVAGKLPTVRLTRRVQIDIRDLERLIEQSKARTTW